jgi:mono/diheme cytochrome c family protein
VQEAWRIRRNRPVQSLFDDGCETSRADAMTETAAEWPRPPILPAIGLVALGVFGRLVLGAASGEAPSADPDHREQVARGKALYQNRCAACHIAELKGQPGGTPLIEEHQMTGMMGVIDIA